MSDTCSASFGYDQSQPQPVLSTQPPSRKRKRACATAPSPAPSEQGSNNAANPLELLSTRTDLSSRPQLSISRGPVFVPTSEGCEYFKTDLVAVNRLGFRYVPAGINPLGHFLPCRTIESNPTSYRISWEDRSPSITVTRDGLGLRGESGFRSARCNAPITEGRWFLEVKIIQGGGEHVADGRREGSHVRLGWGRREAPLNGPVGLDGYSYGYRDKTGDKVTLSRPRPYGRTFGSGDVIGMYISLPPRKTADKKDSNDPAHVKRERIPIDLKGQEVFETLEYPQSKEMISLMDYSDKSVNTASVPSVPKKSAAGKLSERVGPTNLSKTGTSQRRQLPVLQGSRIAFFVNGESQGIAYQNIYDYLQLRQSEKSRKGKEKKRVRDGVKEHRENPFNDGTLGYYPFISLFNDARVRLNPGPNFEYPPPSDIDALLEGEISESLEQKWRPVCERYTEFMDEQLALDAVEEEEARVEASRISVIEKTEATKKAGRAKKRQKSEAKQDVKPGSYDPRLFADEISPPPLNSLGQPSPLRQQTKYEDVEEPLDFIHSPTPTIVSNGELQGQLSGYNSDTMDLDIEVTDNTRELSQGVQDSSKDLAVDQSAFATFCDMIKPVEN